MRQRRATQIDGSKGVSCEAVILRELHVQVEQADVMWNGGFQVRLSFSKCAEK